MEDKKNKQLKGGVVQSIASVTSIKPTATYTNTLQDNRKHRTLIPNSIKLHDKNKLSLNTNKSNKSITYNNTGFNTNYNSKTKKIQPIKTQHSVKSNLVKHLYQEINKPYNNSVIISNSPPNKPPNDDVLFIGMDCLDDDDINTCCKLNNSHCKTNFNTALFKKFLNIIKEIVNILFEEVLKSLNPTVYYGLDVKLVLRASLVSYVVDTVAEDLLKNYHVQEDFKNILFLSFKTFILLPSSDLNPKNLFVKVVAFKLGQTLNLLSLNTLLITLATEKLKEQDIKLIKK